MTDWRSNRIIAGFVIGLFLVIQVAVPIDRLLGEENRRFGWQMYSGVKVAPTFSVTTETGVTEIDLDDFVVSQRVDVGIAQHLPRHLCAVVESADSVEWEEGTYQC